MRYVTAQLVYVVHATLRAAYSRQGQGRTFNPRFPDEETFARLDGATARPRSEFAGVAVHETLFAKVAALGFGIVQGHVFGNGNKRTGLAAMTVALNVNGWDFGMPPEVASLMMLRIASSRERMDLEEAAILLGAFASYRPKIDVTREASNRSLIEAGLVTADLPDIYPASPPGNSTRLEYGQQAQEILRRHEDLLDKTEREILDDSFTWPETMFRSVETWRNVYQHKVKLERRHHLRIRSNRIGRRRRPHNGGRSVPKVCRPVTAIKLRLLRHGAKTPELIEIG